MRRWSILALALGAACGKAAPAVVAPPPALPSEVADVLPWADDLFAGSVSQRAISWDGDAVVFAYSLASRGGVDAGDYRPVQGLRFYRRSSGVLIDLVGPGTDASQFACMSRDGTVVLSAWWSGTRWGIRWWNTETGANGVMDSPPVVGFCELDTARGVLTTSDGAYRFPSGERLVELRGVNRLSASADWLFHTGGYREHAVVDLRTLSVRAVPVPEGTTIASAFWVGDRLFWSGHTTATDGTTSSARHECDPETLGCVARPALASDALSSGFAEASMGRFVDATGGGWLDIDSPDLVHPIRVEGVGGGWPVQLSPDGRVAVIWAAQLYFAELPP